jgi:UDP-glucose 4-epimerase
MFIIPNQGGQNMKILVTGGTGYIGSHTIVELLNAGHDVVAIDNLSNSNAMSLERVSEITGKSVVFHNIDIRDFDSLNSLLDNYYFDCCIHFAGLKAVGESVAKPLDYYDNNVCGTVNLLRALNKHNCKNIIFSSSACVYGNPKIIPISENCPKGLCTNPYGQTKSMIEEIMIDLHKSDSNWNIVLLRYFNPIGAHQSGKIGEDPNGVPNNLMPYITQVAIGKRSELNIFGDDYDTHDGTGVRDYIHVVDLARGHVCALRAIEDKCGLEIFNLGTGHGYSVLDVVHAFEKANGVKIPYVIKPRRVGDVAVCYSDAGKAEQILGWCAEFNLEDMCRDSWNWQKNNPNGYES